MRKFVRAQHTTNRQKRKLVRGGFRGLGASSGWRRSADFTLPEYPARIVIGTPGWRATSSSRSHPPGLQPSDRASAYDLYRGTRGASSALGRQAEGESAPGTRRQGGEGRGCPAEETFRHRSLRQAKHPRQEYARTSFGHDTQFWDTRICLPSRLCWIHASDGPRIEHAGTSSLRNPGEPWLGCKRQTLRVSPAPRPVPHFDDSSARRLRETLPPRRGGRVQRCSRPISSSGPCRPD